MYADTITGSMRRAIDETNRRREIQQKYNTEHGIIPKTIKKSVSEVIEATKSVSDTKIEKQKQSAETVRRTITELTAEMRKAAELLQFELAAQLRDEIKRLEEQLETGDLE